MVKYLVIKTVSYFPSQCAINSVPVIQAMISALTDRGITVEVNSLEADAVIMWSVLWAGRMAPNCEVYQHYRARNCPVIVAEVGALQRGTTWKVAVNHVTAQGHYGHQERLDWDRPAKLGLELAPAASRGSTVVIALQHPRSLQVSHVTDWSQWITHTVQQIRANTDRDIVIRPHPRGPVAVPPQLDVTVQHPRAVPGTYDSYDFGFDCHAVVNINSGPGIQAAIAGVRPVVHNSSLAWPVAVDFAEIEAPYDQDRELWFRQICHTEYTVPELQQGLWLHRLEAVL